MKHTRLATLLTLALILASCSQTPEGDASISMQDRRAFEHLKYRDPATGQIPENIRGRELAFAATLPGAMWRTTKGEQAQAFASFSQVGPYNVGGRTRALAMDVLNPKMMLAGGVSGGVWRTTDAGATWALVSNKDELHNVNTIWQNPRDGRTNEWYYGTGEAWGNSARIAGNGLWKSTDNGMTWRHLTGTATDRVPAAHSFAYAWRVVTSPSDAIYVATARAGIQRSTDGGATWIATLSSNSYFSDLVVTEGGVLFAALSTFTGATGQTAARSGVFRSEDGVTWTDVSPPDIPAGVSRGVIGLVPGTENFFYIAETPGEGTLSVFRLSSGDREMWHSFWKYEGGAWDNRSENIPLFGGRNGDFYSQGGYDLVVRVSPHDTNLVIMGGTNL